MAVSSVANVLKLFQADHGIFSITKSHFIIDAMFSHSKAGQVGFWDQVKTGMTRTRCPCGFIIPPGHNTTFWIVKMTLGCWKWFCWKSKGITRPPSKLGLVSHSKHWSTFHRIVQWLGRSEFHIQDGTSQCFALMHTLSDLMITQSVSTQATSLPKTPPSPPRTITRREMPFGMIKLWMCNFIVIG